MALILIPQVVSVPREHSRVWAVHRWTSLRAAPRASPGFFARLDRPLARPCLRNPKRRCARHRRAPAGHCPGRSTTDRRRPCPFWRCAVPGQARADPGPSEPAQTPRRSFSRARFPSPRRPRLGVGRTRPGPRDWGGTPGWNRCRGGAAGTQRTAGRGRGRTPPQCAEGARCAAGCAASPRPERPLAWRASAPARAHGAHARAHGCSDCEMRPLPNEQTTTTTTITMLMVVGWPWRGQRFGPRAIDGTQFLEGKRGCWFSPRANGEAMWPPLLSLLAPMPMLLLVLSSLARRPLGIFAGPRENAARDRAEPRHGHGAATGLEHGMTIDLPAAATSDRGPAPGKNGRDYLP